MKQFDLKRDTVAEILNWLRRTGGDPTLLRSQVATIVAAVRSEGDIALKRYTSQFDHVISPSIIYSRKDLARQARKVPRDLRQALQHAARNIEKFHASCLRRREPVRRIEPGVMVWREFRAIDRVGVYVPGGQASYPSTVLMGAIPARVAGCREVVVATPVTGRALLPIVALACELAEVDTVYTMGGAQAIAALAYGTKTVTAVDKIVGPGNRWVTEAKRQVYGVVDIDMPAGPSEVMVLADKTARADFVAADMLSQLEHAPDTQAVLVSTSAALLPLVIQELERQTAKLSRKTIIRTALAQSAVVLAPNVNSAVTLANAYAPEHLEIVTTSPKAVLKKIGHAGSVFLGPYTTEPLGDYATGANHTLPTNGGARAFGPLGIESFGKWMQVQEVTRAGFKRLEKTVASLAAAEGLDAHRQAVLIRSEK